MGGAVIFAGCGAPNAISISIPILNAGSVRVDGVALEENSVLVFRPGKSFVCATRDVTRWANVILPLHHAHFPAELTAAVGLEVPAENGVATKMDLCDVYRLRALIARVLEDGANIATRAREENPAEAEFAVNAARGLHVKSASSLRRLGRRRLPRNRILMRALAVIEESEDHRVRIADLCRFNRVSERTMRAIFLEHFGVAPMRFLQQHRLHKIHVALLKADPERDTVTQIAARFGVWDFSSFARCYKSIYEEAPSRTLQRLDGGTETAADDDWVHYAMQRFHAGALQEQPGTTSPGMYRRR